jgi:carbonyl reductase 1
MNEHPVVVVTGANQGLGRALVERLLVSLGPGATLYLTGRNSESVQAAVDELRGRPEPHRLDVRSGAAIDAFAALVAERHGGVDVVISNAAARIVRERPPAEQVRDFVDTNNLGATRMIRAFAPLLRPGGRFLVVGSAFGTLRNLPPRLHASFHTETMSLDDLDRVMGDYVEAVESGTAREQGWPEWINVASKVGQTGAARILAREQRRLAAEDGRLVAAVCPGLVDTGASRPWFDDMSGAQSPAEAAEDIVALVTEPTRPGLYGELVQHGVVLPWR